MERWQYAALMVLCLAVTVPLEPLGAGVYRRGAGAVVRAVFPVVVVFGAWDLVAIARGHWTFGSEFISGVVLPGGMPIEELLFFVVVPLCALSTYEAVGSVIRRVTTRGVSA
ncbi:lycopene cyclase domain-containing protein [Actinosynnema sp. NPDC047251]|uniref:Lycopene cyclase domain protein n=1 Tax=Saccharothrix espanaensis (strain ATCC 51144 / DSM 44229 / JCM 9112 / NBRC 15066 / NRRL 15764) TaxID=1179773 RepID=K0K1Y4_SACES|nr:lycopene cyclase domain-containing protein [Saccharothrix espanaensis]CCH32356.1 Lycopene cyclase domain protein [Saccharothrix espanaensis DSM 44229]